MIAGTAPTRARGGASPPAGSLCRDPLPGREGASVAMAAKNVLADGFGLMPEPRLKRRRVRGREKELTKGFGRGTMTGGAGFRSSPVADGVVVAGGADLAVATEWASSEKVATAKRPSDVSDDDSGDRRWREAREAT